jgi:HEAT repeat protein
MRKRALRVWLPLLLAGLVGCGARGTRDVEKLLNDLASDSERRQRRAERALAEHGRAMINAISAVITGEEIEGLELAESRRQELRVPAARALGVMAERASLARTEAENAAKPLLAALDDENRELRITAANALGHFTQLSEPAGHIVLLLREDDPELVRAAIDALRNNVLQSIDRLVPPEEPAVTAEVRTEWERVLERLKGTDADIRLEAVRELATVRPARAVPILLDRLVNDQSPEVRDTALRIALDMARENPEADFVPQVEAQLARTFQEDEDSRVVLRAAHALAREEAPKQVAAFLERVARAVEACEEKLLRGAGEEGRSELGYDDATRADFIWALRNLHSPERDALLARLLQPQQDESGRIRRAAARVLARADSEAAAEALRTAMEDPDSIVKLVAAQALGRRGDLEAVNYLVELLSHRDVKIRTPAADGLGTLGAKALPVLIRQLEQTLQAARTRAQWEVPLRELERQRDLTDEQEAERDRLLAQRRKHAERAEGEKNLQHVAWGITSGIAGIAGEIGPDAAAPALEAVLRAAKCHYPDVRRAAARALGHLGGRKAMDALIVRLADRDESVRFYASTALEAQGAAAVPALVAALENEQVAAIAADTLGRLAAPQALQPLVEGAAAAGGEARSSIVWAIGATLRSHADAPGADAARKLLASVATSDPTPQTARLARHALRQLRRRGPEKGPE